MPGIRFVWNGPFTALEGAPPFTTLVPGGEYELDAGTVAGLERSDPRWIERPPEGEMAVSTRAQAQAQATMGEALSVTYTEEASTTVANPVTINALTAGALNPTAPWAYQQADMAPKSATNFAVPLQPYANRLVNGVFPFQVMFDFDGETFGVKFSSGSKNGKWRIWANDVPSPYFEMNRAEFFAKVALGSRAQRRIILECDYNIFFAGLVKTKTDSLNAPSESSSRSFAVMGDSFGRGSGIQFINTEAVASSRSYAFTLSRLLGYTTTRNWSVPGTGFCNNGGGAGTYPERLAACLETYKPNIILLQGTTNDHSFTQAEVEAGIISAVTAIRSAAPGTTIVGCTPMPVNNATRTENATNAEACRKAFTALAVPYADGYKAEWFTGEGKVGTETGEGNSDFYSSNITAGHPSLAGHFYLAVRLAQSLAPTLGVGL